MWKKKLLEKLQSSVSSESSVNSSGETDATRNGESFLTSQLNSNTLNAVETVRGSNSQKGSTKSRRNDKKNDDILERTATFHYRPLNKSTKRKGATVKVKFNKKKAKNDIYLVKCTPHDTSPEVVDLEDIINPPLSKERVTAKANSTCDLITSLPVIIKQEVHTPPRVVSPYADIDFMYENGTNNTDPGDYIVTLPSTSTETHSRINNGPIFYANSLNPIKTKSGVHLNMDYYEAISPATSPEPVNAEQEANRAAEQACATQANSVDVIPLYYRAASNSAENCIRVIRSSKPQMPLSANDIKQNDLVVSKLLYMFPHGHLLRLSEFITPRLAIQRYNMLGLKRTQHEINFITFMQKALRNFTMKTGRALQTTEKCENLVPPQNPNANNPRRIFIRNLHQIENSREDIKPQIYHIRPGAPEATLPSQNYPPHHSHVDRTQLPGPSHPRKAQKP